MSGTVVAVNIKDLLQVFHGSTPMTFLHYRLSHRADAGALVTANGRQPLGHLVDFPCF